MTTRFPRSESTIETCQRHLSGLHANSPPIQVDPQIEAVLAAYICSVIYGEAEARVVDIIASRLHRESHDSYVESYAKVASRRLVRSIKISELSGDRAVITYDGVVVAAVNTADLTKAGSASSSTKPSTPSTSGSSIKVGDTVKVKKGAKTYDGGGLASFVYDRNHKVSEVSGNRAVITYDGTVVAAVNTKDLTKVGGSSTSSSSSSSIKKGDKVRVKNGAKTYDGGGLASFVYSTTYDVLEVSGDRVVIGIGSAVTAAVKMSDLTKA